MTSKHYHIHLGPKKTRDSDDDGGRWVTIEGTHVHIGASGKIDKGPPALMDKSEHQANGHAHGEAAAHHAATAKEKGPKHVDTKYHEAAAREHGLASKAFNDAHTATEAGDVKAAKGHHEKAQNHVASAKEHEATLNTPKGAPVGKVVDVQNKPKAHQKIEDAAGKAVKGSEKHEAEHKRLQGLYAKATQNWERSAIARMMERNHVYALDHHAMTGFAMAKTASEHAKKTGGTDDHEAALKAAQDAHEKVMHSSSISGPRESRLQELKAMQQHHAGKLAAIAKDEANAGGIGTGGPLDKFNAAPKASAGGNAAPDAGKPIPPGGKKPALGFKSLEDAKAALGEAAAKQLQAKGVFGEAAPAPAPAKKPAQEKIGATPADQGSSAAKQDDATKATTIMQEAHNDAAATHRAKATNWESPAHGKHEEGGKELAAMHKEAAAHHEHMAANPHEDHRERGKHLGELKKRIAQGESLVQMGQGHKLTGKPKPGAPKTPGKAPGKAAKGSTGSAAVDGATQAVKGLKDVIKKAGDASDPDPKKQA